MYTDINGQNFFKTALHLHTTLSDGRKTPAEVAKIYREDGFDAVAFTDHWYYGNSGSIDGLTVLSGCEYNLGGSSDAMHIVGIGMKTDPKIPKDASRQSVIDKINENGGIAVLAHPAWSLNSLNDALELSGFTATEIYNSVSEQGQSLRAYSDHFVDLCARAGLSYGIFATDDAHYYGGIDDRKGWVMVKAESASQEDILFSLKNGDFYATQGPHLEVIKQEGKLIIDCSPCSVIAVLSDAAWLPDRIIRGESLTHYEYTLTDNDKWARVEIRDQNGKRAWSNIIR